MTDDELIEKMWLEWAEHATPKPFDLKSAMRAILAVVREHDGRDAERWRTLQRMRTENERLLGAVQRAYGYLWHVNNEPGAPNQYAPEQAAYAARRELRELLTHEQRGEGINAARAALAEVGR